MTALKDLKLDVKSVPISFNKPKKLLLNLNYFALIVITLYSFGNISKMLLFINAVTITVSIVYQL